MSTRDGSPPQVQVILVSFEARDSLLACLDSLTQVRVPIEITVVDNASLDRSVHAVRERHPQVRVIANPSNAGFATACNQGWRAGSADLVFFLNPDTEVGPEAVEVLTALLTERPEIAVVAPLTRNTDGTIQVSTGEDLSLRSEIAQRRLVRGVARREPSALTEAERRHAREYEPAWVSGAALMVRRRTLEQTGGFDEGFFLYEEDADLCRRIRAAGGRVLFTPAAEVRHQLGRSMAYHPSRARLEYHRSHLRYYRKHNGTLARFVLRVTIGARGMWRALAHLGPGNHSTRLEGRALLRLAVLGR